MKIRILSLIAAVLVLTASGCAKSNKDEMELLTEKLPVADRVTEEPTRETIEDVTAEATTATQNIDETTQVTDGSAAAKPGYTKPGDNTKPVKPSVPPQETVSSEKPTKPAHPSDNQATEPTPTETKPTTTKPVETAPVVNRPSSSQPEETRPVATKPVETQPTVTEPPLSGWVDRNGERYYVNSEGNLQTGWMTLNGDRYYFNSDGTMVRGIVEIPGYGKRFFTSTGKECILVNPWNYVPDDYSVELVKYGDFKVAAVCADDLKQMLADCKSAGNRAIVCSAYRSYSYQKGLYERRVQRFVDQGYSLEVAKIEAAKRVAIPGTSEHQLGLAVDIVDVNYQNLDEAQENTAAQKWLIANSWRYGFILRYPNNKSDCTGIIYEPWHYRYVGKELAKEIYESGLCMEEYFESLT